MFFSLVVCKFQIGTENNLYDIKIEGKISRKTKATSGRGSKMKGDREGSCLVHGIYLCEDVLMQLSTMHTEHTMKIVLNYDD